MNVDRLAKELEEIYENSCYPNVTEDDKCLALDEQELAIIHMCLESLGNESGYCVDKYTTKDLYILMKNCNFGNRECKYDRVKEQPLKCKQFDRLSGYSLDNVSEILLVYYAVLLLTANDMSTFDYMGKSHRNYFQVYAYFACICPKTFSVLFLNAIYIFMRKAHKCSIGVLERYLEDTEKLWQAYYMLLLRHDIMAEITKEFTKLVSYDKRVFHTNYIKVYRWQVPGFLAFDFMGGDTIPESRYKTVIAGAKYFNRYFELLKNDLQNYSSIPNTIYEKIDSIVKKINLLIEVFCKLLETKVGKTQPIPENFANINELVKRYEKFCEESGAKLIKD